MTKFIPGRQLGFTLGGRVGAETKLEVFVDFTCPFSQRIFRRLREEVKPYYGPKLDVVIMPFSQPWHPSSAMVHECFHSACMSVSPDKSEDILSATFDFALEKYNDVDAMDKSRKQVHLECADLYAALGVPKETFLENLALPPEDKRENKNPGVPATRLVKFYTKAARQVGGLHVSPTCRVNGVTVDTSSGWSLDQWREFLDPLLAGNL